MTNEKRAERRIMYNDDAHRDAWAGLAHMGLWDFKITPEMVGKTFGEAVDSILEDANKESAQ